MPDERAPFGEELTMEEIEAGLAVDDTPEDDDLPEEYRGKSAKEIAAIAETARKALNEKIDLASTIRDAVRPAERETPAPVDDGPKEMTREELKALYDEDPMAALEVMENQLTNRLQRHVNSRLEPMTDGIASQAENWAKQEFAAEFELFGDEIKELVKSVGNKAVFTTKKGWEDAISYVRGKTGNFEKLYEHRQNTTSRASAAAAREREAASSGFTGRSRSGGAPKQSLVDNATIEAGMNPAEKAIAQRFIDDGVFKDMKEYQQWNRRGEA